MMLMRMIAQSIIGRKEEAGASPYLDQVYTSKRATAKPVG